MTYKGRDLRAERKALAITQDALAEAAGVHILVLQAIEAERVVPKEPSIAYLIGIVREMRKETCQ